MKATAALRRSSTIEPLEARIAPAFAAVVNLSSLNGATGFKIQGEATLDRSGFAVSAAGDMNGDGFDDLIIGAYSADPNGTDSGASYVVFGKAGGFSSTPLDLSSLNGATGFKIQGEANGDKSGRSVSGAGDVNGDGFDDLIIGAGGADPNGYESGASYVLFGKAGGFSTPLNLSSLNGANGFKIQGEALNDYSGRSVSGAGDVNGDGFDDLIIAAPNANLDISGASYVVFGKAGGFSTLLNVSTLNGANGFKIQGEAERDFENSSVSGAGDVNGDGFDDLIIGAGGVDQNGSGSGASYLVFGKAGGFGTTLILSSLTGANGFKIQGEAANDRSGGSVSGAGDVNGDGFDDLLIGAERAPNGSYSGVSYVVFGKAGGFNPTLNLSSLTGANGFKIQGEAASDSSGRSVSGAGDVNGDGFDDLLIGAINAGPNASGASYVVFGKADVKVAFSADHKTGTFLDSDADLVTVKLGKGALSQRDFTFSGGVWQKLQISGSPFLVGATDIIVTVKKGFGGDGKVNLGAIDARGLDLGTVTLPGDLGQIDAGDGNFKTPAIKSLIVGSLGAVSGTQPATTINPLQSDLTGTLAKLSVKGSVKGAINITGGTGANLGPVTIGGDLDGSAGGNFAGLLRAGGNIGAVTVKGSVIGGADFSGIIAGGKLGKVSIGAELKSANAAKPVFVSALGDFTATTAAKAVAIAGVSVKTNVLNARILAGYTASLGAANADAGIGAITVLGNWAASSIAAGVADSANNGFGQNDTLIGGDLTPTLLASIASIFIKGTAIGSAGAGDFFGITAQRVTKLTIGTTIHPLTSAANDILLDATNNDFRVVDFA